MNKNREKRKYKRIKRHFIAEIKIRPHYKRNRPSVKWETVTTEDLAARGALFYYHKKLEVGTLLDLKIYFMSFGTTINCTGKVVRVEKPPGSIIFRIGVHFAKISGKDRETVNKAARKL